MRNNFFYILIICAFTEILTKNEEKKPADKEPIKHTREFFEEEAKKDIENLLSSVKKRSFSVEHEDDTEPLNAPGSTQIMARIDEVLTKPKSKNSKRKEKTLRYNDQNIADNFNRDDMQNVPLYLRNNIKSRYNIDKSVAETHPYIGSVKSRISGGHNVNPSLRSLVNHVNIKPDVYPIFTNEYQYTENREKAPREDTIRLNDQYYTNDLDESTKMLREVGTSYKNEPIIRSTIPMTENLDIKKLLNHLHTIRGEEKRREEDILTQKESDNNVRINDFMNTFYTQSANHLRPINRFESVYNHLNDLNDNIESKDRGNSNTFFLRSKVNSVTNDRLDEYKKYFDMGQNLRTSQTSMSYQTNGPSRQGDYRGRKRRSTITQAGYTQDPDTCKIYNENLVKLWSNLPKLINVTEQPSDRDLHNIAMMIQAYLEHQNAKQPPEIHKETHKEIHEGPRDKISEILLKIRKLLDEADVSAEKITKIIIKHLKPDYTDAESEDCQEVNQEYLGISVDVLYKNYLENIDCQGEEEGMARNKEQSLREKNSRTGNAHSGTGQMIVSLAPNDFRPSYQTIHIGDELYNDFHKGKVPRRRPTNKSRRVFKPNKNQRFRLAFRSGNENESEQLQTRSKSSSKSASKRLKKKTLKSNLVKGRCEKYATRKLTVSLRSVMERFMGLLECQLDNTLRSVSRDSKNPYHLYASKFYSEDDSLRHKMMKSRPLAKDTGRLRNKSHKKIHIKRHDTSFESDPDVHVRDEDSAWVRKYTFDKIQSMNSATPLVSRDTNVREPATKRNKHRGDSDYLTTYHEYFQSPPLYGDYDRTYKTQKKTTTSLNDKKMTRDKQSKPNQELSLSSKEPEIENSDEYYTYYEELFTEDPNNLFNVEQQTESSLVETPFTDLTKLRTEDQLIEEKLKAHVKSFESITEFLKRARDSSLQTPEFAVPFALDTNKGYVELTHLIKYPKILVYRPQFLVKNTMPYDDFLKTINNVNMTNDDVRLMKIVRHLPDSSVQVLFETEDFEAPLEVRNLDENRRSGSPDPVENYQFESGIDKANENKNTDLTDGDIADYIPLDRNEARRLDLGGLVKSDLSINMAEELLSPDLNLESDSLRANEELSPTMYFEYNSDQNSKLNFKSNSSESNSDSVVDSAISSNNSQVGAGMELRLDTALNLGNKSKPMHEPPWSSFFSKLFSPHSKLTKTPNLKPQSHINPLSGSIYVSNSHSHSLLPDSDSSNQQVGDDLSSSTQSVVLKWWRKWTGIVKDKIKQFVGEMASLADKIDKIVRT